MSRKNAAVACLMTIATALAGCGEVVLGPDPAGVEPDDPRFIKPIWQRCKPHLSVPTSGSTGAGVELPIFLLRNDDEPVRLELEDGSAADALFNADILVWESGVACGDAGVWWELTADPRSSEPRGEVWSFVGGDVEATLEGDRLAAFEVRGEVCAGPDGECVPASLVAHELTKVVQVAGGEIGPVIVPPPPPQTTTVLMDMVLTWGDSSVRFEAHGHIDYLKQTG